ncbi:MAG: ATP-binding cassette domain-containing protein [Chloroflexi bacterium]|nr:ATP-binding cassette domain-containing protein [Chloroflexota bacterium]
MTDRVMPGVAACEIVDVGYDYGSAMALQGVSLRIEPGESIALIGPSGSGKTTLLRVIAGLLKPQRGTVHIMGRPIAGMKFGRELAGLVGMMQQQLDLVPQLAVKHNIQAGNLGRWGALRSIAALAFPVQSPNARDAARRVGLEDRFTTRVARLSGGEQQRVALARLLVQDPDVMLADEPVSALDPALANDLLALLCDIASEQPGPSGATRTLIASVHQPDLALRYFDRVVALRSGRIVFDKPSAEVAEDDLEQVYALAERRTKKRPVSGSAVSKR